MRPLLVGTRAPLLSTASPEAQFLLREALRVPWAPCAMAPERTPGHTSVDHPLPEPIAPSWEPFERNCVPVAFWGSCGLIFRKPGEEAWIPRSYTRVCLLSCIVKAKQPLTWLTSN